MRVQPVILCGGSGTRLWPLSREQYPKQLLALAGGHTMLQATALRIDAAAVPAGWRLDQPLVVVNEEYRFITAEQLRQVAVHAAIIMLESVGRNTAPALTAAALSAIDGNHTADGDPVLVVMPADHVIVQLESFRDAVAQALPLAAAGRLVTFGIVPTAPETDYGHIPHGPGIPGSQAADIARFVEKPDAETAQRYLASGEYLWNSGIFIMQNLPPLGLLRQYRYRTPLPGEAHCRQAGRSPFTTDAPSPRRALDRGGRHGARDTWRRGVSAGGESVHLHSTRHRPPPGKSGQGAAGNHRSPVRRLSWRG